MGGEIEGEAPLDVRAERRSTPGCPLPATKYPWMSAPSDEVPVDVRSQRRSTPGCPGIGAWADTRTHFARRRGHSDPLRPAPRTLGPTSPATYGESRDIPGFPSSDTASRVGGRAQAAGRRAPTARSRAGRRRRDRRRDRHRRRDRGRAPSPPQRALATAIPPRTRSQTRDPACWRRGLTVEAPFSQRSGWAGAPDVRSAAHSPGDGFTERALEGGWPAPAAHHDPRARVPSARGPRLRHIRPGQVPSYVTRGAAEPPGPTGRRQQS